MRGARTGGADLLRAARLQFGRPGGRARLALATIAAFEGCDYVVAPSGSCAGMLKKHYPALVAGDAAAEAKARAFADRVWELVSFLVDVRHVTGVNSAFEAASPATTAARACASSASRASRAGCSPP